MMKPPLPSKKYLPRTLFGRAILMIVLPILLVQVVTSYLYLDRHLNSITRTLAQDIAGDVAYALHALETTPKENQGAVAKQLEHFFGIQVLSPDQQIKIQNKPSKVSSWADRLLKKAINQKIKTPATVQSSKRDLFITVDIGTERKTFKMSRRRLFNRTTPNIIIWSIISSLMILFIASLFMKNQVRAIERLARAAEKFGKGEDNPSFRPQGAREVRRLGTAFMEMQERIKRQVQQRMDMLAGISHDLRTPLTRMKLELAMLDQTEGTTALQNDVKEMEVMVEEFLEFARGDVQEKTQKTDINTLAQDVLQSLKHESLEIDLDCPKNLMYKCRPLAFKRVLKNLITNAARYASKAQVRFKKKPKELIVVIDDNGPGIPENLRTQVFKPFYRVESSRNTQTGGVGLGLSIVQDIVHSHGGQIELQESPLGGLRVEIRLPR